MVGVGGGRAGRGCLKAEVVAVRLVRILTRVQVVEVQSIPQQRTWEEGAY
jgi:hypothetical protein